MLLFKWLLFVIMQEDAQDLDALTLAKSYFDLKEYDRAAYFLKGCRSQKAYFLYMYSRYLVRFCRCRACPCPFDPSFLCHRKPDFTLIVAFVTHFVIVLLFFSFFSRARKRRMMRLWTAWVRNSSFRPIKDKNEELYLSL